MAIGNMSPAGKSFSGAAEYDLAQGKYASQEQDKKPEILDRNFVFSDDYKELGREFREVSNQNKNCKSPVMKFSVSFDPKEKLTDKQKLDFTKSVMKEMGIKDDNHQYLITRHSDKKHDHHHILANRVGMDKKVIDFSHTRYKLEKSIDKTEKEMGINNDLAKNRRFVYDPTTEKGYRVQKENFQRNRENVNTKDTRKGISEKKEEIKTKVNQALNESRNFSEFRSNLKQSEISTEARFDKSGKLTGVSFNYKDFSVKGSALGKEYKSAEINKKLENNLQKSLNFGQENKTGANLFDQMKAKREEKLKEQEQTKSRGFRR